MYSEKLVEIANSMKDRGFTLRKISELIEVSKSCIHLWLHRTEPKQETSKKIRPEKQERIQKVTHFLQENPDMSIREMAAQLNTSKTSVHRVLKESGFKKKKVYQVGSNDTKKIASLREAFSKRMQPISFHDVISIDETCMYQRMTPTKRWTSKKGRIYLPIQKLESTRYSLIVASTHERIIHAVLVKGSVNKHIFGDFILGIPSSGCYLLMDNVSFHKSDIVKQAMETKQFKPLYTSPYSPEWNPVEMYFSYLKRSFRKFYHERVVHIEEKIVLITKSINISIFTAWYKHVWKQIKSNFHR